MSYLLEQVLNGLSYGLVLSLIAAGFAIVFTSTGVLNFAHGSIVLLGAYLVAVLHEQHRVLARGAGRAGRGRGRRGGHQRRPGAQPGGQEARHRRDPHARAWTSCCSPS